MAHPVHQANKRSPFGDLTSDEFYHKHGVTHQETFILNNDHMKIFTQSWRPAAASRLRGLVAMIHGYSSESGWLFGLTAVAVAKQGFLAVALDLRGHGRSEGPRAHVTSIDPLVADCVQVFDSARAANPSLPAFLYGESLGGAIAVFIALRQPREWSGLVLNGAMCGVSARMKPVWPLEEFLPLAAFFFPTWRAAMFTRSLVGASFKEGWKRELVRSSPAAARRWEHPTFATALVFLRAVKEVERKCGGLEVPLLVVHGGNDVVCNCESAELVYELAGSRDKTMRVLEGAWHQLVGEGEDIVELGFGTIFDWIRERAEKVLGAADANGEATPMASGHA